MPAPSFPTTYNSGKTLRHATPSIGMSPAHASAGTIQNRQEKAIAGQAKLECMRLLVTLARNALPISSSVVLVVAYWLWNLIDHRLILGWVGVMAGLVVTGLTMYARFSASAQDARGAGSWERKFTIKSLINGAAWGALALVTLPVGADNQQIFLVLTLTTVALGATGVLAPSRLAFYGFVFPAMLPLALALILGPTKSFTLAGWSMLAYLGLLLLLHDLFHRSLTSTLIKRLESDALAQEQQVIFDTAGEAICFIKPHFMVKCNRRFGDLLGYSIEEIVGRPSWAWHANYEEWRRIARECEPAIREGRAYTTVTELKRRDGSRFCAEITGRAVDPDNLALGMVWMGEDITARLKTEAALRASEDRFRRLVSLSSDWYWEQDADLRFTRVSGSIFEKNNIDLSTTLGKRRWEDTSVRGVSPEQWRTHRKLLEQHKPFRDFVYQVLGPTGDLRWCSSSGNPVLDENGLFCGYHGVGTDITERVRGAERYRHLAYHDMLTGLPNRRLFSDRLEQAIARARRKGHRVAVMLLDLDDFKIINDTHGHSTGDEVLIAISHRLRQAVRESDTVARLGGDEFVVLLPETLHVEDAATVAQKIIETVREPVAIGNRQYFLGVSIGLALFPEHASNAERLLQQADIAMYIAKRRGGSALQCAVEPGVGGGETPRNPGSTEFDTRKDG